MADSSWSVPFFPPQKGTSLVFYKRSTWELVQIPHLLSLSSDGNPLVAHRRTTRPPTMAHRPGSARRSAHAAKDWRAPLRCTVKKRYRRSDRNIEYHRVDDIEHPTPDQITADHCDDNDAGHQRRNLRCAYFSNIRNDSDARSNIRPQAIVPQYERTTDPYGPQSSMPHLQLTHRQTMNQMSKGILNLTMNRKSGESKGILNLTMNRKSGEQQTMN